MFGNLFKLQFVETGNVSITSSPDSTMTSGLENSSNVTSDGILIIDLIIVGSNNDQTNRNTNDGIEHHKTR